MDQVPTEIQKIILNLCDDKTRRIARVACKQWFNYIDYRDFVIYLTKKSEWSQIVDRLCSYTKPISLHLRKNIINNMKDINEHLLRLTNLTDLTFDDLEDEEEIKTEEWLKLTALPNLHSVNVSNYEYQIPDEVYANFKHLTHFDPRWRSNGDRSLIRTIRQSPDLQSCSIILDQTTEEDIFEQYYSKMTYLFIYMPDLSNKTAEAWFRNCADIKELQYSIRDHKGDEISLKALTKLEKIVFSGGQLHELNSTNLTFLELFNAKEEYIERALDQLINLKELVLDLHADDDDNDEEVDDHPANNNAVAQNDNTNDESDGESNEGDNKVDEVEVSHNNEELDPDAAEKKETTNNNNHEDEASDNNDDENDEENDDDEEESYHSADTDDELLDIDWTNQPRTFSYEWLSSLTSLQHLNIDPMEGDGLTFVPSQIERLQVSAFKPLNLSHVSRFCSLKELYIITNNKKLHDLSAISQLTGLESLQIDLSKGRARLNFPLSVFTNLDWLSLKRCFAEISNLPNLERLILASSSTTGFTGFVGLPKLTQLEFQTNWGFGEGEVVNYTVVSSLTTLKSLSIHPRNLSCDCSYFSTLTALEALKFFQLSSEQDYCYLESLTRLTSLDIWCGLPSEKMLQLPTSLQKLVVDLTKPGGHFASEQLKKQYEGVDVKSITDRLIARLPNLYKYSFD